MDVHIFYFHEEKQQVLRSYIRPHFLGHTDVEKTFQSTILDKMGFPMHLATLEFSLFICNGIKPFLTFFSRRTPLAVFLYEKLKEFLISIMGRFIRPAIFAANSSTQKMVKIDLKKEENMISPGNLHLGVGTTRAINKCTTTQAVEVRKFKQNARKNFLFVWLKS